MKWYIDLNRTTHILLDVHMINFLTSLLPFHCDISSVRFSFIDMQCCLDPSDFHKHDSRPFGGYSSFFFPFHFFCLVLGTWHTRIVCCVCSMNVWFSWVVVSIIVVFSSIFAVNKRRKNLVPSRITHIMKICVCLQTITVQSSNVVACLVKWNVWKWMAKCSRQWIDGWRFLCGFGISDIKTQRQWKIIKQSKGKGKEKKGKT